MFFFFTTADDGTVKHFFSKTYEEHQQVIADNTGDGKNSGTGDKGEAA